MDFAEIYAVYFRDVYLYLKGLSSNTDVAEELTQEVFSKALKALPRFDGSKDLRAWLFTIARNAYFTFCKQNKRFVQAESVDFLPDTHVSFTERMEDQEQALLIHCFLHDMKEPYKEVFSLRVFGELSFETIGKIFGKGSGWARVTFHRARKQIIEYMEELNNE